MTAIDSIWLVYPVAGLITGFLAGLLGIGGAILLVPLLVYEFTRQGFPAAHLFVMAIGTTFANILFTSAASMLAHHRRQGVAWPTFRAMAPGIVVGTFAGTVLAVRVPGRLLEALFTGFLVWVGVRMLRPAVAQPAHHAPGALSMAAVGAGIGAFSSMTGAGGGTMTVPFLHRCGLRFQQAVGTGAALGFPIALAGAAGYMINGLGTPGLPAHSIGYVYLPALAGLTIAAMLTAPLGARLAHRLPVSRLRRVFAVCLLLVAVKIGLSFF